MGLGLQTDVNSVVFSNLLFLEHESDGLISGRCGYIGGLDRTLRVMIRCPVKKNLVIRIIAALRNWTARTWWKVRKDLRVPKKRRVLPDPIPGGCSQISD